MSPQLYPHLLPAEAVIWARFLARYGGAWDRFDYDIRLGRGRPVDPTIPQEIQDDWIHLTKKRVDAVGFKGPQPTLFEISPRLSRTVLGALEAYRDLWNEDPPTPGAPDLVAVVGRGDPDLQRVMEQRGIRVFVIPPSEEG